MSTKKLQILSSLGGNADTVDGKHASDFAEASDVEQLHTLVGDNSVHEQITSAIAPINTALDTKVDKSGGTVTGDTMFEQYLKINAYPSATQAYGTGSANLWYNGNEKRLYIENATDLSLNGTDVSKAGHQHQGENIYPAAIEFDPSESTGHGGFIDFHMNGSSEDYTSRIIETGAGLNFIANIILSNRAYGNTLPAAGYPGRIFFKKVQ